MIQTRVLLLILISSFMLTIDLDARHIVGGDVTYQFKYYSPDSSQVTYDIFFNMYRDTESNGANFDQPGGVAGGARFAVYRKTSLGDWEFIWTTGELDLDANPVQIPIIDDPCRQEPDNVGVESGTYSFEVTLDVSEYEYMIAYQRCCRNPNVLNIFDSGGTGVAFNVIISPEAQSNGNSSAVFSEYPPIFVCAGFPMDIDVSGTDIDGDVLRYSFCTPSAAGGDAGGKDVCDGWSPDPLNCFPPFNDVVFINPYDASNPMGGSPPVTINPFTGQLTGVPDVIGQFVIGMCIEEFRNGQLIGVVSRDFQFNVTTCTKDLTAALKADGTEIGQADGVNTLVNVIKACGDSTVFFENLSFGNELRDYTWEIKDPNDSIIFTRYDASKVNFTAEFPELGFYTGTMIANDGTDCPDTAFFRIERLPDMRTGFVYDTSFMCYLGPLQFTDTTYTEQATVEEWEWSFGNGDSSIVSNPLYEFDTRGMKTVTLISRDSNGCVDTLVTQVDYNPPHDSLLTETLEFPLCYGETFIWYGDTITEATNRNKIITYEETGCDSVSTSIKVDYSPKPDSIYLNPILCPGEIYTYLNTDYSVAGEYQDFTRSLRFNCDSIYHFISLEYDVLPTINFDVDTAFVEAFEDYRLEVSIAGDYDQAIWTPASGLDCGDCPYPTANYNIDNTYELELVTDIGCRTSNSFFIDFIPIPEKYYIPTIISQSGGSRDNKFYLQTVDWASEDVVYDISIYDRWGGLRHIKENVFVNDETQAWEITDGISPGSYAYTITVKEFFETHFYSGTITVIK